MRVLGFDFGTGHIGAAAGNTVSLTCQALPALKARDGIPDETQLVKLLKEWQPEHLVVGLPLNMDGSEQEMTRRARKFGNRLAQRCRIEVSFVDERLTSKEAKAEIFEKGGFAALKKDKGGIDSLSAVKILEQYFDSLPEERE